MTGIWKKFSMALTTAMVAAAVVSSASAQERQVQVSPYAQTVQRIGVSDVTITYHRPGVKGREIWNTKIVPYGGDPIPWRAGANDTTVIAFEADVTINGEALPAGEYGFHIIPTEGEWTLIFSKTSKEWGSYKYDPKEDALRVKTTPVEAPHEEWLRYGFDELKADSAVAYLHWEKKKIPFTIALAK